jgi:Immunity protein 35
MSMTKNEAQQIARAHVKAMGQTAGIELVMFDQHTIEREFGWVFFYDSKRHIETGNISDAIAGNAPLIVTKDGHVHSTGTAHPVEHYLREFEQRFKATMSDGFQMDIVDIFQFADGRTVFVGEVTGGPIFITKCRCSLWLGEKYLQEIEIEGEMIPSQQATAPTSLRSVSSPPNTVVLGDVMAKNRNLRLICRV